MSTDAERIRRLERKQADTEDRLSRALKDIAALQVKLREANGQRPSDVPWHTPPVE